jgi:hypothetical protein
MLLKSVEILFWDGLLNLGGLGENHKKYRENGQV